MPKIKVDKAERLHVEKETGIITKTISIRVRASDLDIKPGIELRNRIKSQYRLKKLVGKQFFIFFELNYYLGNKRKRKSEEEMISNYLKMSEGSVYYHNYNPETNFEIDSEILIKAVERSRHKNKRFKLPKKYDG